jgi:hypothetical protein
MHGMLSAAIILIVFAMVAAVGGGAAAWLYRAASGSAGHPRRSSDRSENSENVPPETAAGTPAPADSVADTRSDLPARPASATLPALPAPPTDEAGDEGDGDEEAGEVEEFEGARIYLLDSYPRSGR